MALPAAAAAAAAGEEEKEEEEAAPKLPGLHTIPSFVQVYCQVGWRPVWYLRVHVCMRACCVCVCVCVHVHTHV
jgi:hypothetical protein